MRRFIFFNVVILMLGLIGSINGCNRATGNNRLWREWPANARATSRIWFFSRAVGPLHPDHSMAIERAVCVSTGARNHGPARRSG